jgi:hypothetical protein
VLVLGEAAGMELRWVASVFVVVWGARLFVEFLKLFFCFKGGWRFGSDALEETEDLAFDVTVTGIDKSDDVAPLVWLDIVEFSASGCSSSPLLNCCTADTKSWIGELDASWPKSCNR